MPKNEIVRRGLIKGEIPLYADGRNGLGRIADGRDMTTRTPIEWIEVFDDRAGFLATVAAAAAVRLIEIVVLPPPLTD
jgi:hypothetical protein